MGMADIKEVKCRPQLSEMGLINAHINCGTITSDVACNVNDNSFILSQSNNDQLFNGLLNGNSAHIILILNLRNDFIWNILPLNGEDQA